MGRHKNTPIDIRDYIRKRSDWMALVRAMNRIALGGYEYENYNKQKIVAQPNIEAMKLLLLFAWGRPSEVAPENNDESLQAFVNFISDNNMILPTQQRKELVTREQKDNGK